MAAGVADGIDPPPRPWLKIQGTNDATTLWYALLRRRERGVYIGSLVLRHSDHYACLLAGGWEEVAVDELRDGPGGDAPPPDQAM